MFFLLALCQHVSLIREIQKVFLVCSASPFPGFKLSLSLSLSLPIQLKLGEKSEMEFFVSGVPPRWWCETRTW